MLNQSLSALIIATVMALSPQGIVIAEQSAQTTQPGKKLYRRHCIHCHGGQLQRFTQLDQHTFNKTVISGSNLMPGFAAQLSQVELENLWVYLKAQTSSH